MLHRVVILGVVLLVMAPPSTQAADPRPAVVSGAVSLSERHLVNDPPRPHLCALEARSTPDTVWFGGEGPDGTAMPGGLWDFDDGTLQGWSSIDLTAQEDYFRHVTADSCLFHDDPDCTVITAGGSLGSMWVGAHEDEAIAMCFPGGQGYGNNWVQELRKTFTYDGNGSVTLEFDYFVDSETQFDFTYVYLIDSDGIQSGPFNTSAYPNSNGFGYSGANAEGTGIGSPGIPAHDSLTIDSTFLGPAGDVEILFRFDSDALYSDGIDGFGTFLNTIGPFGCDNVSVVGGGISDFSDFEPDGDEYDGWMSTPPPGVGPLMAVRHLSDLDPIPDDEACTCPLAEYVMIASDVDGEVNHPHDQQERLISNPTYVGPGSEGFGSPTRLIRWGVWQDLPLDAGIAYRVRAHYYPWTCPVTSEIGWTLEPAGAGGYIFSAIGDCTTYFTDVSGFLPNEVDSIKVVIELSAGLCDDIPGDCHEDPNQSPYWDEIRLGLTGTVNAPPIAPDVLYLDCFAIENSLAPWEPAEMVSFYDNNRGDGDPTNANMGDSTVVVAGVGDNTHVYLNYRVYPGVGMWDVPGGTGGVTDPFFTECGPANTIENPQGWAVARMDTAETSSGLFPGAFATYHHEGSCGYQEPEQVPDPGGVMVPNPANKILPDALFVPGTTVEYFFTSSYGPIDQATEVGAYPDTTGEFYLEVEVLPGYMTQAVQDPINNTFAPCFLYVDAFNVGAQPPIQDFGLRPYLGTIIDVNGREHDNWSRYDHLAAQTNVAAPFARESNGNNGCTKHQSMIFRSALWNSGSATSGMRDRDADLFINFLTNNDYGRPDFQKGLWLSGNAMPTMLDDPQSPNLQALLADYAGATVAFGGQGYGTVNDDLSLCVRLDPSVGRHFPGSVASYGALRGNGCPAQLAFQVMGTNGPGVGNMEYVDQDGNGSMPVVQYASVSNDQFVPTNAANYAVVLDAWSLHYLRYTPDGWTGSDCGTDSSAIGERIIDVFNWFHVTTTVCEYEPPLDSPASDPDASLPVHTRLFRNTPNPFNPQTTIRYELAGEARVTVMVFDVTGQVVRTLVDDAQAPGAYRVAWDGATDAGTRVSSGVYWLRMTTSAGFRASTKVVLLK